MLSAAERQGGWHWRCPAHTGCALRARVAPCGHTRTACCSCFTGALVQLNWLGYACRARPPPHTPNAAHAPPATGCCCTATAHAARRVGARAVPSSTASSRAGACTHRPCMRAVRLWPAGPRPPAAAAHGLNTGACAAPPRPRAAIGFGTAAHPHPPPPRAGRDGQPPARPRAAQGAGQPQDAARACRDAGVAGQGWCAAAAACVHAARNARALGQRAATRAMCQAGWRAACLPSMLQADPAAAMQKHGGDADVMAVLAKLTTFDMSRAQQEAVQAMGASPGELARTIYGWVGAALRCSTPDRAARREARSHPAAAALPRGLCPAATASWQQSCSSRACARRWRSSVRMPLLHPPSTRAMLRSWGCWTSWARHWART